MGGRQPAARVGAVPLTAAGGLPLAPTRRRVASPRPGTRRRGTPAGGEGRLQGQLLADLGGGVHRPVRLRPRRLPRGVQHRHLRRELRRQWRGRGRRGEGHPEASVAALGFLSISCALRGSCDLLLGPCSPVYPPLRRAQPRWVGLDPAFFWWTPPPGILQLRWECWLEKRC